MSSKVRIFSIMSLQLITHGLCFQVPPWKHSKACRISCVLGQTGFDLRSKRSNGGKSRISVLYIVLAGVTPLLQRSQRPSAQSGIGQDIYASSDQKVSLPSFLLRSASFHYAIVLGSKSVVLQTSALQWPKNRNT